MICAVLLIAAQERTPHKPKPVDKDSAPITVAEFNQVAARVEKALQKAIGPLKLAPLSKDAKVPVAAPEVVGRLHIWFAAAKPKFRLTPKMAKPDGTRHTFATPQLKELLAWRLMNPKALLITDRTLRVSPGELGDTLGYFLTRLAELTHAPSSKFTPSMMPPGG